MSRHKVVMVSAEEVSAWASRWPASGMRDKGAVAFTFEGNGDLVDIEPYGWDEGVDGAAAVALSQDAQQGIIGSVVGGSEGTPLSTRAVLGNPPSYSGVKPGEWPDSERPGVSYRAHGWNRGFGEKVQRIDVLVNGHVIGFIQTRVTFKRGRMPERVSTMTGTLSGGGVSGRHVDWLLREVNAANRGDFGVRPSRGNPRRVKLTPEAIQAATMDAGNRSMRGAGRTTWSEGDRDAASAEADRLWALYDQSGHAKENAGDVHIDIHSHNARGGRARAVANPAAAVPVEIRGDGSDWIRMLSFFQRYRRGSAAKFAHNTALRTKSTGVVGSDDVEVVLHETPIVTFHADGTMTLNSGGYRTATTKARINALLPPSVHLVQIGGKWLLRSGGDSHPFFDGMRFGVATFPHGHRSPG